MEKNIFKNLNCVGHWQKGANSKKQKIHKQKRCIEWEKKNNQKDIYNKDEEQKNKKILRGKKSREKKRFCKYLS